MRGLAQVQIAWIPMLKWTNHRPGANLESGRSLHRFLRSGGRQTEKEGDGR